MMMKKTTEGFLFDSEVIAEHSAKLVDFLGKNDLTDEQKGEVLHFWLTLLHSHEGDYELELTGDILTAKKYGEKEALEIAEGVESVASYFSEDLMTDDFLTYVKGEAE